jgi:cytochrome c oxidase subunit II
LTCFSPADASAHRPWHRRSSNPAVLGALAIAITGCAGQQSALAPAGEEAAELARQFWVMIAGGAVVWGVMIGAAVYGVLANPGEHTERRANAFIIGGGIVFPTVGLATLLAFTLRALPGVPDEDPALRVHVHGEQFWWRVVYERGGERVTSANEIHLPAGEPVEFVLTSADVIHSFWMPTIGGKMDMIPGRTNRLVLTPTEPGVYRGQCAEFCGESHALMAFAVEVHTPEAFDQWLAAATAPAEADAVEAGRELFLASGCGACHVVRGLVELGSVGPDLTHFGSRRTLGAGIAPNTPETVARWITDPEAMKPGVEMPAFGMLPDDEIAAIAAFLGSLE